MKEKYKKPTSADFSGIVNQTNAGGNSISFDVRLNPTPDHIQVIQKAMIEVGEEGTEAAAANVAVENVFNANHPFVFFLRDLKTGTLIFRGRVVNQK